MIKLTGVNKMSRQHVPQQELVHQAMNDHPSPPLHQNINKMQQTVA
jgi:hypothetical protein